MEQHAEKQWILRPTRQPPVSSNGFTLIELLIVVAIIAILAAIAVPNFLEAQTRSKVARAKNDARTLALAIEAYFVDHNALFPDGDDPGIDFPDRTFTQETGIPHDAVSDDVQLLYGLRLRTFWRWRPLTTPVSYIASIPTDSFSRVMPYGYTTWWDGERKRPFYCLVSSMGPDRDMDFAYRAPNSIYDPTNGAKSNGDVYRVAAVSHPYWVRYFFGDYFDLNP